MIIIILDWIGTIFILLGNYLISSKGAENSKIRFIALGFFLISNIVWIPFAILLGVEGLLATQILLMPMNIRGILILRKKLKNPNK